MRPKPGLLLSEANARDGAIRTAIGRMLAAQYDLAEPLPDRFAKLLKRLERTDETGAAEIRRAYIR